MLLGVYYTLSNLEKVDDGDLTVTYCGYTTSVLSHILYTEKPPDTDLFRYQGVCYTFFEVIPDDERSITVVAILETT